jgi:hypothetical protein
MHKPGASASTQSEVPVPASAVPTFSTPQRVVTDGFWSNLKQFLTEKPIKVNIKTKSPLMPADYVYWLCENDSVLSAVVDNDLSRDRALL